MDPHQSFVEPDVLFLGYSSANGESAGARSSWTQKMLRKFMHNKRNSTEITGTKIFLGIQDLGYQCNKNFCLHC